MKVDIRTYSEGDLEDLLLTWERATKLAHPFLTESFLEKEKYNIPNLYLPNADTWVLVISERVVGFIALIGNEVGALFVDPEYHRKGFGKLLMDKAQGLHNRLEVEVFKENSLGRDFYQRYGFIVQQQKIHKETGCQLLRLFYTP